jgi:Xaa-Pro aminopeptidase
MSDTPASAFSPRTYAERRRALASSVGDGIILLPGNDPAPMNYAGNVYAFRQDGSFLYYAGLDEPGLTLTIDAATGESVLHGYDPTMDDVVWEGHAESLSSRGERAGVERTAAPDALAGAVEAARRAGRTIHVLPPYRGETRLKLAGLLGTGADAVAPSTTLIDAVIAQRLVKTADEIAELEEALLITARMHEMARQMARPGVTEFEVAAQMEAVAVGAGSAVSFPIILTRHGEVLHGLPKLGAAFQAGDLMLADAGAVSPRGRYAGDITRVTPVDGRFSDRQRAVYEAVLAGQMAAIEGVRPGVPYRDLHELAARVIVEHLTEVGIFRGDAAEIVAAHGHAILFPHGLGHALGLDVHDMEALGEDRVGYDDEFKRSDQFGTRFLRFARRLKEGYVMTVEPGVYFIDALIDQWRAAGTHAQFIDYDELDKWRGFGGYRIEDNVVVTSGGCRVLGPFMPKIVADVESAVGR